MKINIPEKTLIDLEFPAIRKRVCSFCVTEPGMEKALRTKPFKSDEAVLIALNQTQEYQSSFLEDEQIPNHGFDGVDDEIRLLAIENSILECSGFQKIAALSKSANAHLSFFGKHEERYPNLHKITADVTYTKAIVQSIAAIIDRFGEIRDDASPLLQSLRQSIARVQGQIDSSFSAELVACHNAGYLDDIRESVVADQRVLAVSAMYRRKVKGALLGRSKTGSIVFIQPESTMKFMRQLNNLRFEEKEETNRILKELTDRIRPFRSLLIDYQDLLSEMDLIAAKVHFAAGMDGILPKITENRELNLKEAYHPLLYLTNRESGKETHPQHIKMDDENRIIIISGPNAGGKSITLKTVGLLQAMLQSGMLIPVHEYSRMCLFDRILTDIGDHQSIENHLSTYSYRLKNMRYFLRNCGSRSLFLIDEFGTGSDPELGGALAETFLEVFHKSRAFGVITTHYVRLKKMAEETPGITNANMRFDSHRLSPEYKLQMGEAGSSFTFEVAQKMGIRYSLINRAKKKVERGKIRFDKSIAKLQNERSKLAKTNKTLEDEKQDAAEQKSQLEATNQRIQKKLEDFQLLYDRHQKYIQLGEKLDQLSDAFLHDHDKKHLINELLKLVTVENAKRGKQSKKQRDRQKRHHENVKNEARNKIKPIRERKKASQQKETRQAQVARQKEIASFSKNDRVRLKGSKAVGTITKVEKGKAFVNYGIFTTEVSLEKLEAVKKVGP